MNYSSLLSYLPRIPVEQYIPAPDRFYSSAGSLLGAAAIGALYGLAGRVVYPQAGIFPLHYSIWFTVAFQIKSTVTFLGNRADKFMHTGTPFEEMEKVSRGKLSWKDQIRYPYLKGVELKNSLLKSIDDVASKRLHIRPYSEIKQENVAEASFLEMCRYRVWRVFRETLLETACSVIAYQITTTVGFSLPARTSVPLFILARSFMKDIVFVPSLHYYARLVIDQKKNAQSGITWIRKLLPAV